MLTLETLAAKQAITELIYSYCRALDRMDEELALRIWHPDAIVDYGEAFQGGVQDFIKVTWRIHSTMDSHSHQVTNILIVVDGLKAVSESYFTAALRYMNEVGAPVELTVRGRYLDRFSCRDGCWAIDERRVVHDFSDVAEIIPSTAPPTGRRDKGDPSWAFLGGALSPQVSNSEIQR